MKQQVAIISSVGSNLASLKFALDRLDANYFETEDPQKIIIIISMIGKLIMIGISVAPLVLAM